MNIHAPPLGINPLAKPVDFLLADIAIRVQLSRTNHNKSIEHYQAIQNWIDRDGSLLKGLVQLLYPQGSMAIDATIASKLTTDEFDIDIVAQLALDPSLTPQQVLDLLYVSIRGEKGSRYYDKTIRQTRCVTVEYADMHLDITPMIRRVNTPDRESFLFHHCPERPDEPSYALIGNPFGFAELFKQRTPADMAFADVFEQRSKAYDLIILAEADVDEVPEQVPLYRKSKAVVILQLLKRWRNVRYDRRDGRKPPSIMKSELVAQAANQSNTLSEELLLQSRHMLTVFEAAHRAGQCVEIRNPACPEHDVLTDRWPGDLQTQAVFIDDLRDLVAQVERLCGPCSLPKMQAIMSDLFGETPTGAAFKSFNQTNGAAIVGGKSHHQRGSGKFVAPSVVGATAAPAKVSATPKHTFFGGEADDR